METDDPGRSKWSRLGGPLLTGLVFLSVLVLALHKIVALDVWWQIRTGEWILAHGIPDSDPFSYAFPGREWIEPRWLYCVLVYLVFDTFGANALILLEALFVLTTFGLLYRVAPRPGRRWAALVGLTLALATGYERFMVRPEMVSFVGLAATLLLLERYRTSGDRRWIYGLPLLQVVWCNAHTLWILGPAVQWIVLAGEVLDGRLCRAGPAPSALRPRALVALASSGVALANPYLLSGVLFPLRLFREIGGGQLLGENIAEFLSPFSALLLDADYPTVAYLGALGLSLLAFALNYHRVPLSRALLWAAFVVLSLRAQRNVSLFGIVAAFATMLNLGEYADSARERSGRRLLPVLARVAVAVHALVLIPLVATDRFYRDQGSLRQFGLGVSERRFPVRPLAFVRASGLPTPVLNTLGDGGYVLFEGGPGSVYIDGRLEVYGERILDRALRVTRTGEGLTAEADRVGARTVLVRNRIEHRELLLWLERSPDWVPVYYDPLHVVYLRLSAQTRALADRYAIDWQRPPARDVPRPSRVAPPDRLAGWWPRVGDGFEDERLGSLFLAVGNYSRALESFERAVERQPDLPRACLHAGLFYRALGREDEAHELLSRVPSAWLQRADVNTLAGEIHMGSRQPEKAIDYFRSALESGNAGPGASERLARAAIAAGRYDLAETTLRGRLERFPRHHEAWSLLGVLAIRRERLEQAIEPLLRSLELEPGQARVYRTLGSVYAGLQRHDEAQRMFEQADRLDPQP